METPWRCWNCGEENWIDLECLDEWPLDRLVSAMGYVCTNCGMREAISYTTLSLREAERKLTSYPVMHRKYPFLFAKLVTKQRGVNLRGKEKHGTREFPDLAVP